MKNLFAILMAGLMVVSLSACASPNNQASSSATSESSGPAVIDTTGVTLTYWVELNANTSQVVQEMGQTEYAKQLQEKTGIKIQYQHPPVGQAKESFSILIASSDYPDIIEYNWIDYPGGPIAAIDNKVILPLNEAFEKYSPNISKLLKENPNVDKMVRTDDGKYYVYPFLRELTTENNPLLFSEGWAIRKDYLEKIGKEVPSTPAEWYDVLKAFKTELKLETPLVLRKDHVSRALSTGFDSWDDFYVEDGKVKNGLIEPQRKDYLTEISKWYKEGLLDNEFLVTDSKTQSTKVLNSKTGATWAPGGSGMGTWIPALLKTNPESKFTSASQMTPVKGRNSKFAKMNSVYTNVGCAAISTSCKRVDVAAKLLDFNYSEEGRMLANFGIEGVTYEMKNGYPTFTDTILKNPNGWTITQAMGNYIRANTNGPFVQDKRELEQYYQQPELKEALQLWTKTDMGKYMMPPVSATTAESEELAQIMNNVSTYKDEMEAKFIMGVEPLSKYDDYVKQLKSFNIERAIEIKQAAYDRYMARK